MKYLKKLIPLFLCAVLSGSLYSQVQQKHTVEVSNNQSGVVLPDVSVQCINLKTKIVQGAITNSKGTAEISFTPDSVLLTVSCVGYRTYCDTLRLGALTSVKLVEDIFNLEQVTVTGTRTPHSLKSTPVLTQLVSRRDIESTRAVTVIDLLESEIPSAEVNRHGFGASLSSQGLEAKYTLMLIDCERIAGESDANIDFSRINAANIERVEIVKGATSSLYGSSAMGSVINIITKKPSKTFDVNVDLRYAEQNEKNVEKAEIDKIDDKYLRAFYRNQDRQNLNSDISLGYKSGNFYSQNYFGYKSADAYQLFNSKSIVKYYPELDSTAYEGVDQNPSNINGFANYTFSTKTGLTGHRWRSEFKGSLYNHEEFDFVRDNKHNLYRDYTIGGSAERSFSDSSLLRISYNYDIYNKYTLLERLERKELYYSNVFNHAKVIYTTHLNPKHNVLVAAEYFNEYLRSDRFVALKINSHTIYDAVIVLQDEYSLSKYLTMVGSIRTGTHSMHRLHVSPSVTVRLVQGDFSHRASYARGFRSPTLKELYMNWDHQGMFVIVGNKDLKPETSNYYSVSTDYVDSQRLLNLTATVALNQIYDRLGGIWTNNQTEYHYKNLDDYNVLNAEFSARWKFLNRFLLKAGYVYTDVLEKESVARLSGVSKHIVTGQLEYSVRKNGYELTSNISVKVIGQKDLSEFDESVNTYYYMSYPTYSLWNINVNQRFKNQLSLTIGVKNLFDYSAPIAGFSTTDSPGRRFYIAVGYAF
mgnify:FL=1